jgi:hypothetical protein
MMGTFAPAVDFAAAKLIREKEMNCRHSDFLEQFLTAFGYTEEERDNFIAKSPEENGGKGVGLVNA